ncbi:hypothetical protein G9464_02100 [Halostella sp. JP-L12]|uniref:hypothetical protein n=1 Tax=Halostella TaxID=1843185 RepID=UPI0013CEA48C|nr:MULTISPECIES: hypothetical protein [Halostella]NHN46394.1 hypothetical protein [Halostella sp. JP-L12]
MSVKNLIQEFMELPVSLQLTIGALGLAAVQQSRQGHIGRVGIASAGAIVIGAAYPIWGQLPEMWRMYSIVAVPFTAIAALSYLSRTSLPTEFYKLALLLYGAIPVILALVYGFPL